jgi:hypothetical protein
MGCPLPPYIKEQGGGRRPRRRARQGGSPTPTGSRTPPFLVGVGEGKGEGERRKGAPPSLVQFGLVQGEGCGHPFGPYSPFPYGPMRPNTNSRNSPVLRKIPESLGTFPKSEYSRPIYRSLCLAISRLLVMSPISSGTPNSFGTSKLINS